MDMPLRKRARGIILNKRADNPPKKGKMTPPKGGKGKGKGKKPYLRFQSTTSGKRESNSTPKLHFLSRRMTSLYSPDR